MDTPFCRHVYENVEQDPCEYCGQPSHRIDWKAARKGAFTEILEIVNGGGDAHYKEHLVREHIRNEITEHPQG